MLAFILAVLNLCYKELLAVLKDPASRAILIVPIFIQSVIFGYAATYDLDHIPYAVLDQSHSQSAASLLAHFEGNNLFERVATLSNAEQIKSLIDNQKALLVVHIEQDFEKNLQAGKTASVQLILDARNSNTAGIAANYVSSIVETYNTELSGQKSLINIETRAWYNPNLESRWNIMPAMIATLSFLQTLILTALSVAREREQGTFDQLLVTPLSPLQIMLGKAIPPILIGLVQALMVLLVVLFWFKIPIEGSVFTLFVGMLLFMIACVGLGLSISALSLTMQQAMLYTFVLIMPMILLSGLTTPISNMPVAMQYLTLLNPLRYAIDFVRRVYLEGVGLWQLSYDLWPLLIIAMVTLPIATWLFRNKLS